MVYTIIVVAVVVTAIAIWGNHFSKKVPIISNSKNISFDKKLKVVDEWLHNLCDKHKFNGGIIVRKQESILVKHYGYFDPINKLPFTSSSSFELASVSKHITASAIMLLKENGELQYDDPIAKYISKFPYKISIRSLMHHTSGIPDIYTWIEKQNINNINFSNSDVMGLVIDGTLKPLQKEYSKFEYSNTNYILLAHIIEIITGTHFGIFLKKNLFNKLEMLNSHVVPERKPVSDIPNLVCSFTSLMGIKAEFKSDFIYRPTGDGGIHCSLSDIVKWNSLWDYNIIISKESISNSITAPVLTNGITSNYGFGWAISGDGDTLWHNGRWLGTRTIMVRKRSSNQYFFLVDNYNNKNFDKIYQEILNYLDMNFNQKLA